MKIYRVTRKVTYVLDMGVKADSEADAIAKAQDSHRGKWREVDDEIQDETAEEIGED